MHVQVVENYFRDRLGIDGELAQIAAGSDLRCEAAWMPSSGLNIFVTANGFKARVSRLIHGLEEDVMVMARLSIVAYRHHECTQLQPCDCPDPWCTVMDVVRTFLWTTE